MRELAQAQSAVRLSNGDIVVAAPRESRLVWFDAAGRFVRSVGRRGAGPGEFGRSVFVYARADTIVAHDPSNARFHYIDARGNTVRMDTLGDRRREAWMYGRTLFFRTPDGVSWADLAATVARIPRAARDTIRFAHAARDGSVWIRDSRDTMSYVVHAPDGRVRGTVRGAERFEIYQVLDSLVLGRWRDADGIEVIQLRRWSIAPAPSGTPAVTTASAPYDQAEVLARDAALAMQLRASARNLVTAMEAYFADHGRYARSATELRWELPPGVRLTLFGASAREYGALLEHSGTPIACVLLMFADNFAAGFPVCG